MDEAGSREPLFRGEETMMKMEDIRRGSLADAEPRTELQVRLNSAPELKAAFEALTPGRRKSYIFHISGAK